MRRLIHFPLLLCMTILALMLVSCDEKEDEVDALVGTYVFTSATFLDTVHIIIQQMEHEFLPGSDASDFVGPGLLGAAPCDDPENAAIELKNNGTIFFACLSEENQEQMGNWLINAERTVLTLNMSNPQPFSLNISDLTTTATSFAGTVDNFPLPINAGLDLGPTNIQVAPVELSFTKVS